MKKYSTATWKGSGKEGSGVITSESKALTNASYRWSTRFTEDKGMNPEELIAAAHAGCFSMKLSFLLGDAGYVPEIIQTTSTVTLEEKGITGSHLDVKAKVPGIPQERFDECAEKAKNECPVSKALNVSITMNASVDNGVMNAPVKD